VTARRIEQRVLLALIGVVAAVLLPAMFLIERWVGADVREGVAAAVNREAVVLASELDRAPPADLPAWVASLPADARVTVVDLDGRVLADSEVPREGLSQLENHKNRPEIARALNGQIGNEERRSSTLGRSLYYAAVPVGNPPRLVLRLAIPLDLVSKTVGRAQVAVWLAGLVALVLALFLGIVVARWLSRPILAMTRAARAMSHGQFDAVLPEPSDDELGDLLHALETLRTQLASRIEDLKQEGVKLRTILTGMAEGVALVQDGVITVANPSFGRLLNLPTDVEGRGVRDATRLPAMGEVIDAAAVERKELAREVQVGGRSLLVSAHPLAGPTARQAVVVLIDMTEAKRLERLRRDFVANASHELRTPVAAIVGVADTLAAGAADDPDARKSFLDILVRHAQRLSRLTADLLDIARLEAGYKPRVERVPVDATVETVLSTLKGKAADKQIELGGKVPPDLHLAAERAAVEQILTNLVDNAIKYTPAGGRVLVTAERKEGQVQLAVEDTGPGIPREHHARLFERFYRVDDARSRDLGGTGLGLAIVKHLTLAHGGEVRVESEPGKGSRFLVSLPRS
jgi:two-component system phosphate regulon sensor histidine kinase PhoR